MAMLNNQMVYHFHNSYGCGDFPTSCLQTTPQVGWEQKSSDGHLDGLLRAAGLKPGTLGDTPRT